MPKPKDQADHDKTPKTEPAAPLRRSTRTSIRGRSSAVTPTPEARSRVSTRKPPSTMEAESRRNPKRKAAQVTPPPAEDVRWDLLLERAHAPLNQEELEQWEGWVELESDPAFFSTILHDWGVVNFKADEMLTLSEESVEMLPKPIAGLIFLFKYREDPDDDDEDPPETDLWFANQTTNNACATVAMLNIVMNSPDAELGPELAKFKESSRDLSSVLRGYELSRHAFLRGVHNSFSRRMDQLNEDLLLENEASNNAKSNKRSRATKSRARARKGPAARSQTSFHFVAYVPVDGRVWELDGLRGAPRSIGVADPADWTSVARDHIQARMLQYADDPDGCAFNLLALCRSPLQAIARRVAEHLATLQRLRSIIRSRPDLVDAVDLSDSIRFSLDDDNAADEILSEFHLTMGDIEAASVQDLPEEQSANAAAAQELHDSLVVSIKATMGEYRSELLASADGQQRVAGRKNDYGPALHKWVSILAEKNALLGLVKQHDPAK